MSGHSPESGLSVSLGRLEPEPSKHLRTKNPYYHSLGNPSGEAERLLGQAIAALSNLDYAAKQLPDPTTSFFMGRAYYEVFNRPKTAIRLLWKALWPITEKEPFVAREIRHYINRIYSETRGVTLEEIEAHIHSKIDPRYHELVGSIRPDADIILLEGSDFTWEYDRGYYDPEWEGAGPNDIESHLKIRRIEIS